MENSLNEFNLNNNLNQKNEVFWDDLEKRKNFAAFVRGEEVSDQDELFQFVTTNPDSINGLIVAMNGHKEDFLTNRLDPEFSKFTNDYISLIDEFSHTIKDEDFQSDFKNLLGAYGDEFMKVAGMSADEALKRIKEVRDNIKNFISTKIAITSDEESLKWKQKLELVNMRFASIEEKLQIVADKHNSDEIGKEERLLKMKRIDERITALEDLKKKISNQAYQSN